MSANEQPDLRESRGLVATCNLTGLVEGATMDCLSNTRAYMIEHGFRQIEWRTFYAQLVEAGRDEICRHALDPRGDGTEEPYDWILMFDGDATFAPDALLRLLHAAYLEVPESDVVGAYSQLKGSHLPTIDTGTGTWEPHFPGEGIVQVIRTGGHFLLIKTPILQRFGPPWFRTRQTWKAVDALREVDNYARIKMDGKNPLAEHEAWSTLMDLAHKEGAGGTSGVGEDSAFCDNVKAAGGDIYVNTDVVTGHIERKIISPADLRKMMDERERHPRLAVGVME